MAQLFDRRIEEPAEKRLLRQRGQNDRGEADKHLRGEGNGWTAQLLDQFLRLEVEAAFLRQLSQQRLQPDQRLGRDQTHAKTDSDRAPSRVSGKKRLAQ